MNQPLEVMSVIHIRAPNPLPLDEDNN